MCKDSRTGALSGPCHQRCCAARKKCFKKKSRGFSENCLWYFFSITNSLLTCAVYGTVIRWFRTRYRKRAKMFCPKSKNADTLLRKLRETCLSSFLRDLERLKGLKRKCVKRSHGTLSVGIISNEHLCRLLYFELFSLRKKGAIKLSYHSFLRNNSRKG